MDDRAKQLGIWAGLGAALGLGVALGLGARVLAAGALVGVGAGVALGVAAGRKRDEPADELPAPLAARDVRIALH